MNTSAQDLKQTWNNFAETYSQTVENGNLQLGLSLSRMLRVSSAKNILEVGCGSGALAVDLLRILPPGIKYTSLDISDEMINLAIKRKQANANKINDIDHSFVNANAEDVSFIPDESIDVYMAPLCLHITPDPNQALKEAMRVLKKGGRIGFVVLGRYENCEGFTIFGDRLKEFNIPKPETRSIFRYGEREALIKLAEDNGIQVDFCWQETVALDAFNEVDLEGILKSPSNVKMLNQMDQETHLKVTERMRQIFEEKKKNHSPLKNECTLLVGRKPEGKSQN